MSSHDNWDKLGYDVKKGDETHVGPRSWVDMVTRGESLGVSGRREMGQGHGNVCLDISDFYVTF